MRTKRIICYVGVDPGATGALCFLLPGNRLFFLDFPRKKNITRMANRMELLLRKYEPRLAVVEKVSSKTGQGVKSTFSFGMNYGMWLMAVAIFKIPCLERTPLQWQKGFLTKTDGPDPKARVENVVCRLFPDQIDQFYGPRGGYKDGRADAAAMAWRAKMIDNGEAQ
jgi:Holliday junction resolvasome RuvABC endonuclease subunit